MNRNFKGVWIPKNIYTNKELSWTEKIILVEIDSLDNDLEKGCFASNAYLSEFLGISEGTCANIISGLKSKNYLHQVFFDGRNRGLRLNNSFKDETSFHEKVKPAFTKSLKQGTRKNEHTNTDNNTTDVVDVLPPSSSNLTFEKNTIQHHYEKFMLTESTQKNNFCMTKRKTKKEMEILCIGYVMSLLERGETMASYKPDFNHHFFNWLNSFGFDNIKSIDKEHISLQFKKLNMYQDGN